MTNDTRTALLENLTATPRQTAVELGITIADAKALEAEGLIVNFGTRVTGKRGRPPIEWVVAGTEVSDNQQEAVEAAKRRVGLVRRYDAIGSRMWRLREAYPALLVRPCKGKVPEDVIAEYNSLVDEKTAIYEVTGGTAPQARPNDYVLVGEDFDTASEAEREAELIAA